MMMKHLLWKDARMIKPLFVAIVIGIVVIDLMLCACQYFLETRLEIEVFVTFWILLPSIFAFGAPAMMVGTEEEHGTLGWLRTLPVRWQQVVDSKFIVTLAALAATWIVSTLGLVVTTAAMGVADRWSPEEFGALAGIASLIFFNLLVLATGFVTAYLFRSPVAGLMTVVPMVLTIWMIVIAFAKIADWLIPSQYGIQAVGRASETFAFTIASLLSIGLLSVLWGSSRLLARRRLASPHSELLKNLIAQEPASVYRPPLLVIPKRPSQTTALLWQHYRQVRMPCIALTLLTIVSWTIPTLTTGTLLQGVGASILGLPVLVLYFGPCWLGGLAFYGDNVNKRHRFFADRGIGARSVWWTRLATPSACVVAIVAVFTFLVVWSPSHTLGGAANYSVTWVFAILIQFSLGVFVGQWMQRGVMTFLLPPVLMMVGGAILATFVRNYDLSYELYIWLTLLSPIVLLIGSRMLTGRWLRDQVDRGYHIRAAACCLLAIALPMVLMLV